MTGLDWIAALLNPSDVAPHPNFMDAELVTPPSLLALLVQQRLRDFERLAKIGLTSADSEVSVLNPDPVQAELVLLARASFDVSRQREGAEGLRTLAANRSLEPGARAAACLMAAVAFSELDEHPQLLDDLIALDRSLGDHPPPDVRLIKAVIVQQAAMRKAELGQSSAHEALRALELLDGLRAQDFSVFRTSKGVSWRSSQTMSQILISLRATSESHAATVRREVMFRDWRRFVRAPAPVLPLRVERAANSANWEFVKQQFAQESGSTTRTLFSEDPIEPPCYSVLLHYELMGDLGRSREWRTRLGMIRVLRWVAGAGDDVVPAYQDAVRLFRQAEDLDSLDHALRLVRARGPLESLARDARQVIRNRLQPDTLRLSDLAVLAAAAPVLPRTEARRALSGVLEALDVFLPAKGRGVQLYAVRADRGWTAAVALATTARRQDDVAAALLKAAEQAPADELLERALVRAAWGLEWEGVSRATLSKWRRWLEQAASAISFAMRDVIGTQLGVGVGFDQSEPLTLDRIASLLNASIGSREVPPRAIVKRSASIVSQALRDTQQQARSGVYSFGPASTADIAAGIGLYWTASEVWEPLAELLSDPAVNPGDKSAALDRLAEPDASVPGEFVSAIQSALPDVLDATVLDPFSESFTPLPSGLRFAARHGLLDDNALHARVFELVASPLTAARAEATRTLSLMARLRDVSGWVTVLALVLSADRDALVKAEAGRCLATLAGRSKYMTASIQRRLDELLRSDGLLVPLLVLRGLSDQRALGPPLLDTIQAIARSHPAHGVRIQAEAVLSGPNRKRRGNAA